MELSIIVPTFNEGCNVLQLAERIANSLRDHNSYEVLFVDDSTDDTELYLQHLTRQYPEFRYVHRTEKRGLASAVMEGFHIAHGHIIVVMDADLQHPPEIIPKMLDTIREGSDIVVPSRFVRGGGDGGLNWLRKIVSWSARWIARLAIPRARPISDPTSGFFAIRRRVIEHVTLQPIGWKILLEVIVRGNYTSMTELPYHFEERSGGFSKLNAREQLNYLRHVLLLMRSDPASRRFWLFCLVGTSGMLLNSSIYYGLIRVQWGPATSYTAASLVAMLSNFVLNNRFTWQYAKENSVWYRLLKFSLISCAGIGLSSMVVYALTHVFEWNVMLAGFTGIAASVFWNYTLNSAWTFQKRGSKHEYPVLDQFAAVPLGSRGENKNA